MRLLFLNILFDDKEKIREDNDLFAVYGGYHGIISRSFPAETEVIHFNPALRGAGATARLRDSLCRGQIEAIVVGGSTIDISASQSIRDWQEALWSLLRQAVRWNIPVLGICGGHQYGARAFTRDKNTVVLNPAGRNFGTSALTLTPEGREHSLFLGLDDPILCQWSHRYIVDSLMSDEFEFVVLGGHSKTQHAVFQCGSFIGMQFHPEFALPEASAGVDIMRILGGLRQAAYIAEGLVVDEAAFARFLEDSLAPAPTSHLIIRNWTNMIRNGYFDQLKNKW